MKVLIACEYSGIIREEFRKKGHDAWSCDLLPSQIPGPHFQCDVKEVLYKYCWDLLIAHPTCTRLTNSCWWYIVKYRLYDEVKEAAEFFNLFLNSGIKRIAIENPIQNHEAKKYIHKQDQIIQPYNFGENASKATGLWLVNLPKLQNTSYYPPRIVNGKPRWGNQTDGGWNKLPPTPDRAKIRSKTYPGIGKAMAEQWNF
jgi:hypothetical protein